MRAIVSRVFLEQIANAKAHWIRQQHLGNLLNRAGPIDGINNLIVDSDWIGGFEHLLHLGFRLGKLSMCL